MTPRPPDISIVVPCYRCAPFLKELYERVQDALKSSDTSFELILVNDASPDRDWEVIQELSDADDRVLGIEFSRNFGQHCAITCGLDHARSEWVVVMDGDLQDRPEDIPQLYTKAKTGYDAVFAKRGQRGDSLYRKAVSHAFYALLSYLTDTKQDPGIGNFGIYNRCVTQAVRSMPERLRYFPVMVRWAGFKTCELTVTRDRRDLTASSYSFMRLTKLAINIMIGFSDKPLKLVAQFGLLLSLLAGCGGLTVLVRAAAGDFSVQGWPSLMVTIIFLGGLNIFVLGILGVYLGKVFDETKRRPLYLVRQTTLRSEIHTRDIPA